MAESGPLTIFIPMFEDFASDNRHGVNRFFDIDHVPERLTCPGFLSAERYQTAADVPLPGPYGSQPLRYLNFYYIAEPEVITSEAYRRQIRHRTPWPGRRGGGNGAIGTMLREVWVQRPSPWESATILAQSDGPKTFLLVMEDIDPAHDDDFNRFLDEEQVPMHLSWPGFLRCERFEGGTITLPGRVPHAPPKYMTLYYLESPEIVSTDAYREQAAFQSPWAARLAGKTTLYSRGVYVQRPSPWTTRPTQVG